MVHVEHQAPHKKPYLLEEFGHPAPVNAAREGRVMHDDKSSAHETTIHAYRIIASLLLLSSPSINTGPQQKQTTLKSMAPPFLEKMGRSSSTKMLLLLVALISCFHCHLAARHPVFHSGPATDDASSGALLASYSMFKLKSYV
jgi:hypothetical protein